MRKPRKKYWSLKQQSHINLLDELRFEPGGWFNYLRMDNEPYLDLLHSVMPLIKKSGPQMRTAITPLERCGVTLHFLATGRSYEDLKFHFYQNNL